MTGRSLEIEIKAKIASVAEMAERIAGAGAVFECDLVHEDIYFDRPAKLGSFARTDEALRLRISRNETAGKEEVFLTYKGPKVDATTKTREEVDVAVADAGKVRRILALLGFKEVIVIEKVRKHYQHGDVSIMLDRVEGLPDPYMEVEILADDEGALDARREQLFRYLEGVGIGRGASERMSYLELVLSARAGTLPTS